MTSREQKIEKILTGAPHQMQPLLLFSIMSYAMLRDLRQTTGYARGVWFALFGDTLEFQCVPPQTTIWQVFILPGFC